MKPFTFLTPWTAVAAGAIAVPLLLLLYFLKLRRREVPISSTLLWKKAVMDMQVNAPFQKLRRNLLLFLQLIVLGAILLSLGTPMGKWTQRQVAKRIILVDHSASMNTKEQNATRLELAKQAAANYVHDLDANDEAMVIALADRARVVCPFTSDKAQLTHQIDLIEPTDGGSKLADALQLALAYANPSRTVDLPGAPPPVVEAQIELFSDGRISDADSQIVQRGKMRFFRIGQATDNVGIVRMDVRRSYEKPSTITVFAQLENFGSAAVKADVSLRLDGRDLPAVKEVSLGPAIPEGEKEKPGGPKGALPTQDVIFEFEHEGGGVIDVVLHRDDALDADNIARAPLDPPRQPNLLAVTDREVIRHHFNKALRSLPLGKVDWMTSEAYEAANDDALMRDGRPIYDVVILDNHSTAKLPTGGYIFFGGVPKVEGVTQGDPVEDDVIASWDDTHPMMRYVNFEQVYAQRWFKLGLPAYSVPLVEGERSVIVAYLPTPGRQFVICAFDLAESNWLLRVPFVVFLYNATRFLSNAGLNDEMRVLRPGDTFSAPPMKSAGDVSVTRPDGKVDTVPVASGQRPTYARTLDTGVYTMRGPGESTLRFAVNLLDENESNIAPKQAFSVGAETVARADARERVNRPVWPWLVVGALAVLMFEWWIYNRRVML